ncbi:LysR family transcriptional regulator [Caulobacter sp. S45]|uniref:LysR family transcriptional regulator n=1 Tax=Caulobacter sp. S45 TaxID=1641861 RepID=UPI00131E530A|nr:LysR family transcriptional regulator [Caulobacter sp. S45]
MADLNDIVVFVKVAQLESFSRAARALGMPVSTVSRRIAELEGALGVVLLQRTTRSLTLTSQGRDYFNQCSEPLNLLVDAERVLTQTQRMPEGLLRVSVPVTLGQDIFLEFISDFLNNHPRIKIDLFITNIFLDLIVENIDVSIRFGDLKDSALVAQKLGSQIRYIVASKDYLQGRGLPVEPDDLVSHSCVLLNAKNNEGEWELISGQKRKTISVLGPIASRDFQSVSSFVYRGHGVGFLPSSYCEAKIETGELVRLLPEWTSKQVDIHAVYPTRKFRPARLQLFLEALKSWKDAPWTSPTAELGA